MHSWTHLRIQNEGNSEIAKKMDGTYQKLGFMIQEQNMGMSEKITLVPSAKDQDSILQHQNLYGSFSGNLRTPANLDPEGEANSASK